MGEVAPGPNRRKLRGVTLIELMIGLVVISVTLTAAGPSFNGMIARNRVSTQVNDFILATQVARTEATRMGRIVTIQAAGAAGNNEFGLGFCVIVGKPGDVGYPNDCSGTLIRRFETLSGGSTLNSVENTATVSFDSMGALTETAGSPRQFDLCNSNAPGRRIFINPIGRSKSHAPDDLDAAKRPDCP